MFQILPKYGISFFKMTDFLNGMPGARLVRTSAKSSQPLLQGVR
ncbi:MAG: hypothetical protein ACP5UI_04720 [Thermoprotei archaeon]